MRGDEAAALSGFSSTSAGAVPRTLRPDNPGRLAGRRRPSPHEIRRASYFGHHEPRSDSDTIARCNP
jgi:hypothetical protein